MTVPGRLEMTDAQEGWPNQFHPGSLNVLIPRDGYPDGFGNPDDGGTGVATLDQGIPAPCTVLPWDKIGNNGLNPKPRKPRRGAGQFWRARLTVISTGQTANCWVFRRIDSTIKRQLEVISESRLRSTLSLEDGTEVFVDILQENETERTQERSCNRGVPPS
jgi:hypothetical protein